MKALKFMNEQLPSGTVAENCSEGHVIVSRLGISRDDIDDEVSQLRI